MKIRKSLRSAAAAIAALMLLAACTPDGGSVSGSGERNFVVAVGTNPTQLNPAITTDNTTEAIGQSIFEPLVSLSKNFSLVPMLAKSWESNKDATEFTFHLQSGVTWHDGKPFTSTDVKFFFEQVLKLNPSGAPIAAALNTVDTPDDLTAVVRLKEPFAPLVEAMTSLPLIPAHIYSGTDITTNPANLAPIGTGPFVFDRFDSGDSIVVKKNPNYWGKAGKVSSVVYKVMPDASARSLALQSGDIDMIPATFLDLSQINVLKSKDSFYVYGADYKPQQMVMFYNTKKPAFSDVRVRQALLQSIDRSAIASKVYLDTATPAHAPIPNQMSWAIEPSVNFLEQFPYDVDKAGALLDAAGYPRGPDGTRFTANLSFISGLPTFSGTADLVRSDLAAIGVKANVVAQDVNVYAASTFTKSDFDLTVLELSGFADPNLGVARAYVCNPRKSAFVNPSGFCDEGIDSAWKTAGQQIDRPSRVAAFTKAQQLISGTLGAAPLVSAVTNGALRADKWTGLETFTANRQQDWSALTPK